MADAGARAAQLADQIRDYLATWIARDFPGYLVSVGQVTLTPDLQRATVWVTTYNVEHRAIVLRKLKQHQREYQKRLYTQLKRHSAPIISFLPDYSYEDAERIDTLLK